MVMHDYDSDGSKVVLLLHPMLASGSLMYELIGSQLGDSIRCLAPDFGAHGDQRGTEFVSASVEADQVMDYLQHMNVSHIDLAYGASLGGVVLTELLKRGLKPDQAYFEGTSFFVNARLLTKIVSRVFIKKHRRAVADHERAVVAMGELYGKSNAEAFADQFIAMSEASIHNIAVSCGNNEPAVLSPDMQARCTFAYGAKDPNMIKAKKGCLRAYPDAHLVVWDGFGHCDKIIADTTAYAQMLRGYLL